MIQLVVFKSGRFQEVFEIEADSVTVGRGDWNDLVLPDGSVSRDHARLIRRGTSLEIVDLGSRNKIGMNGVSLTRATLEPGAEFQLGQFSLHARLVPPPIRAPIAGPAGSRGDEAYRVLDSLFLLSSRFGSMVEVADLLEKMFDELLRIFQADRGLILLVDPRTGRLEPRFSRQLDPRAKDWAISQTIAQQVVRTGAPILTTDALAEMQYAGIDSIQREQLRSIVCVPLASDTGDPALAPAPAPAPSPRGPPGDDTPPLRAGETLGVLYLDSRTAVRVFSSQDLKLLHTFARHAVDALEKARERDRLRSDVRNLTQVQRDVHQQQHDFAHIVAVNRRMVELLDQVRDVASEDVTTLILGESGTGKELIAKAIHYSSRRREKPFVAVNCMALATDIIESELFGHEKGAFTGAMDRRVGRFELADGGTIFLDEIGDLSPAIQLKLLRVLQEKQIQRVGSNQPLDIDVRVITATNVDLREALKTSRFREDLYYRLNVFSVTLPPLRQRMEDIPSLAGFFIDHFNRTMGKAIEGLSAGALKALQSYSWPGNIRELKNVIERAFALCKGPIIETRWLPTDLLGSTGDGFSAEELSIDNFPPDFHVARDLFEKNFLLKYLKLNRGNIAATAQQIGLPRKTIYRKLEEYKIPRDSLDDSDQE